MADYSRFLEEYRDQKKKIDGSSEGMNILLVGAGNSTRNPYISNKYLIDIAHVEIQEYSTLQQTENNIPQTSTGETSLNLTSLGALPGCNETSQPLYPGDDLINLMSVWDLDYDEYGNLTTSNNSWEDVYPTHWSDPQG